MATKTKYIRQFKCTYCGDNNNCMLILTSQNGKIDAPYACPYGGHVEWVEVQKE